MYVEPDPDPAVEKRAKTWRFRADFVHDYDLPKGTWQVDGVTQEEPLTQASLLAAVNREGKKPLVAVAAPLHMTVHGITGFMPPYKS